MKGYLITLEDDSFIRLCAENHPTKGPGENTITVDEHKITFEVGVRTIDEDEDFMCEQELLS